MFNPLMIPQFLHQHMHSNTDKMKFASFISSSAESNACEDMGNRVGKILLDWAKQ